ncbi:MAG: HEAT repeat domain-containing protein [Anaerolineae bacterium]|nr:HEAT repeat domain-containing protein [Anaerolineae bacterium]
MAEQPVSGNEPQLSHSAEPDDAPGIGGAQGKSHSRAYLNSSEPDARRRALIALGSEPDAFLTLYRGLWDTDQGVRAEAARLLAHHGTDMAGHLLRHASEIDGHPGRLEAVAVLGLRPTNSNINLLLDLVFHANSLLRRAAEEGLVLAGKAALDPLANRVVCTSSSAVREAMLALARIASQVEDDTRKGECQQILIDKLLYSRDDNEAASALVYFPTQNAVAALLEAMKTRSESVKGACSDTLAQIGSPAVEPLLAYAQEVGLASQGDRVLRSLARMDFALLPGILEGLENRAIIKRFALLVANYHIDRLQPLLHHKRRQFRLAAIAALDAVRPSIIQPLIEMSTHPDPYTRQRAVMALGNNPYEPVQNFSVLRQALTDEAWRVRAAACIGLGKLYERAASAAYGSDRWQARSFLYAFSSPVTIVPNLLIGSIEDEEMRVRVSAIRGLGRCADSTPAVDALIGVVRGNEHALHSEAVAALIAIGGEHESIHDALLVASGPTYTTAARHRAIDGVVRFERGTDLPQLMPLLVDNSHLLRQKAAKAIRHIVIHSTGLTEDTQQTMRGYLIDGVTVQRVFAAYALASFGDKEGLQALLLDLLKYNELPLMSASHLSRIFKSYSDIVNALVQKIEADFGL